MSEICYKPVRSSVNYHVMFLQNPIPQAVLAADGQFVDANSPRAIYDGLYKYMTTEEVVASAFRDG